MNLTLFLLGSFPVLLNEGKNVFCKKEFIHPREHA